MRGKQPRGRAIGGGLSQSAPITLDFATDRSVPLDNQPPQAVRSASAGGA